VTGYQKFKLRRHTNKEANASAGQHSFRDTLGVQAKAIIEALVKSHAKVENKTLCERLAELGARDTLANMLVAVEVDTLSDKLSMVKTKGWWLQLLIG